MHDGTIVSKADSRDRSEGFAGGKFSERIINFFTDNKINRWRCPQGLFRLHRHRWSDEGNLEVRFGRLQHFSELHIILPADSAGVESDELIFSGNGNRLLRGDGVGWCIQQATLRNHRGRIG